MVAAYLVAIAAIVAGLVLLIHMAVRVENFPIDILDRPNWQDGYLRLVFGVIFTISGGVFTLMTRVIQADLCRPSAWEQRLERDLEVGRLKVIFSKVGRLDRR
jgi:hypothetical protein